jgi:hypothetical protein
VAAHKLTRSQAARLKALRRHAVHELAIICGGDPEVELIIGRQFADQIAPRKEGPAYRQSVFINCPFDAPYLPLLHAATFAVVRCGFVPRCALERGDSSEPRFERILRMIEECQYGVHDLSRIELDRGFPRFNMPLELGVFLGAKRYGRHAQDRKSCLIFERTPHTYDRFISDFSGYDVASHGNRPQRVVRAIRDWLSSAARKRSIPGSHKLGYAEFKKWLPEKCSSTGLLLGELTWVEFAELAKEWSKNNPWALVVDAK